MIRTLIRGAVISAILVLAPNYALADEHDSLSSAPVMPSPSIAEHSFQVAQGKKQGGGGGGGGGGKTCPAGYADCDGSKANKCETNIQTDLSNCGACGKTCSLPNATAACTNGTCGIGSCKTGYADCDGNTSNGCETTVATDVKNCGACGNTCSTPNGTSACTNGACGIGSCSTGYADCDGNPSNGCETNVAGSDANNCGACGQTCQTGYKCAAGQCEADLEKYPLACLINYTANCDLNSSTGPNGCEINIGTDLNNCGACGKKCGPYPNATAVECKASIYVHSTSDIQAALTGTLEVCEITSCTAGYGNCDGKASNGCETNVGTDVNNCGACGYQCAGGACTNGTCENPCPTGYGNCDGNASNGCEVNLQNNANNCGACGTVCSLPNASSSCTNGTCAIGSCNTGYADCDGNPSNGCETNIATSANNCGACGKVCSFPNTYPYCENGTCTFVNCQYCHEDCDGNKSNGCEIDVCSDKNNCGQCGLICPESCTNRSCFR